MVQGDLTVLSMAHAASKAFVVVEDCVQAGREMKKKWPTRPHLVICFHITQHRRLL